MLNKNRKVNESKNVSCLVSLLNGFQVVRMVELLGLLGCVEYIRGEGGLGSFGCRVVTPPNQGIFSLLVY